VRILVTGSRDWTDRDTISVALRGYYDRNRTAVLVHGAARGADLIAAGIWYLLGGQLEAHEAKWRTQGTAAGVIRNQEMVDAGADVCLAFPLGESRGTRDCMRRAAKAGIPVINYGDA
jgi:hypothetical protein